MWISFEVQARDREGLLEEIGLLVSRENTYLGVERGGYLNAAWCEGSILPQIVKVRGEEDVPEF